MTKAYLLQNSVAKACLLEEYWLVGYCVAKACLLEYLIAKALLLKYWVVKACLLEQWLPRCDCLRSTELEEYWYSKVCLQKYWAAKAYCLSITELLNYASWSTELQRPTAGGVAEHACRSTQLPRHNFLLSTKWLSMPASVMSWQGMIAWVLSC